MKKGWDIFMHSVRLVLRNLGPALRVSALLYTVQVAGQVSALYSPIEAAEVPGMAAEPSLLSVILAFAAIVASLWIAVGWHRFVLEEEYPQGWLPRWHGATLLRYLWRSIVVGIVVVLGILVAFIPIMLFLAIAPAVAGIFAFGMIGLGGYLFFRLGVTLPAAAVGHRLSLREGWRATKDADGAIVVLAFIVIGASLVIQAPALVNPDPTSIVNVVYTIVTGWFATIIGVSVLTTLYGHYVQGRPID
ncbi:hypothetical protein [Citreimonas salinaria]|uniref:Uncharacterized protein n=1 Tax=Citreimonas salinaria TaxID=321339 RepID=A0A1H3FCD1_9RHOB|nr:hypothetical protein [Citreimonas salinaria]SDX88457.1 hypothetical protein SAMN05444340_101333 [Citreimonas salinaria]